MKTRVMWVPIDMLRHSSEEGVKTDGNVTRSLISGTVSFALFHFHSSICKTRVLSDESMVTGCVGSTLRSEKYR